MKDFPELEELIIDEELEDIIKGANKYSFPVVTLSTNVYFNTAAAPLISNYIKWSITPNYVIISPAKKTDFNSYTVRKVGKSADNTNTTFPVILNKEKKIKHGSYRLYKCKNGLAFKRYERLEEEDG